MNNLSRIALRLLFVAALVAIAFTSVQVATAFCISVDGLCTQDSTMPRRCL